jgi:hypothetical protein
MEASTESYASAVGEVLAQNGLHQGYVRTCYGAHTHAGRHRRTIENPTPMDCTPACSYYGSLADSDALLARDIEFLQCLETGEVSAAPDTATPEVGSSLSDKTADHRARHRQRQAHYRSRQKVFAAQHHFGQVGANNPAPRR